MAPKRLPWSVRAIAGKPSWAARSTSRLRRAAPSSRLYSEWTWRWRKSAASPMPGSVLSSRTGLGGGHRADEDADRPTNPRPHGDRQPDPEQPVGGAARRARGRDLAGGIHDRLEPAEERHADVGQGDQQ